MNFHHISVMPQETVSGLVTNRDGIYVDCTLGGAGHSHLIADMLSEKGRLIGIDQDESAIAAATERLQDCHCQVSIVQNNFRNLEQVLQEQSAQQVDGVLFDLGVSSHQLDTAERGFSYMQDAPLDMRMDQQARLSAYDVVNNYDEAELNRIINHWLVTDDGKIKQSAEYIGMALMYDETRLERIINNGIKIDDVIAYD